MARMSDPAARRAYATLITTLREIALLGSANSVLHWDEQTQLPPKARPLRADQCSLLARMVHERFTSPRVDELLKEVEGSSLVRDIESDEAVNVREARREYDRDRKLPASLVEEQARTAVMAQQAWGEARAKSEFATFEPWLAKTLDLKRQEAGCIGYAREAYDAL